MTEKTLSLQERRQLEQEITALANLTTEQALITAARSIAHGYPASQVLVVLLKHLGTSSSQLRGGLAHLATLLPTDESVPALRRYAANRQNPPQGRFAAATILERFLGETISPGLLTDLQSNDDAAFESLSEAVAESKQNRFILFEYVTQMREHDEGIAFAVMDALARLPEADRVELLRLITQDHREVVAENALTRLDQLAASGENRAAVRAMATLQRVLPEKSASAIERSLRKLQMRGKGYKAPSPQEWRALISPADPAGNQSLWLVKTPTDVESGDVRCTLISTIVNLRNGIMAFYCSEQIDPSMIPAPPIGVPIVKVQTENGESIFLEAPIDYGLWLVQNALLRNHQGEGAILLPPEYHLFNDLIWQFQPTLDESIVQLWAAAQSTQDAPRLDAEELERDTEVLMAHLSMTAWVFHGLPTPNQSAPFFGKKLDSSQVAMVILREIAQVPERTQLLEALEGGLRLQSAWLHLAGEAALADCARRLVIALPQISMTENPLLRKMVERGLAMDASKHTS
ncbi:MAG: hypothetical protein U0175_21640 [Caldilineaceae bacterium]